MPTVDNEGTSISFQVQGSGPALLLIAGTGYPASTWHPRFLDLLAESFQVITFDHRGTGASPGTDHEYSTELFARDAAAVLGATTSAPAHVLGHSMGGRVAQWLAIDEPSRVDRLVLAATGAGVEEGAGLATDRRARLDGVRRGDGRPPRVRRPAAAVHLLHRGVRRAPGPDGGVAGRGLLGPSTPAARLPEARGRTAVPLLPRPDPRDLRAHLGAGGRSGHPRGRHRVPRRSVGGAEPVCSRTASSSSSAGSSTASSGRPSTSPPTWSASG